MSRTLIDASLIAPFSNTFVGMGRNRIVNGEMRISQQAGGAAVTVNTSSVFHPVDQFWATAWTAAGVYTIQRSTSSPPTDFTHFIRATCTTADTSLAGKRYGIETPIEGYGVRDFLLGSSSAKSFTLSFWVRSSLTGIYSGSFVNGGNTRAYAFEYTINAANTWERKTITILGDTSGTWLTDSGVGLRVIFGLALGSGWQQAAGSWTGTADIFGSNNQVNFMSSNTSRTWDITGVQLELGPSATGFEYRPFADELIYCQRYYEKTYAVDTAVGTVTTTGLQKVSVLGASTTVAQFYTAYFRVEKRITPTMTGYSTSGVLGKITVNGPGTAEVDSTFDITSAASTTAEIRATGVPSSTITVNSIYQLKCHWIADARL